MALRKGKCYTRPERPYTRKSKVKAKGYIKAAPGPKIAKFVMGDVVGFWRARYPWLVNLIMLEPIQLRDNAIEAARQQVHRHLEEKLKGSYYFAVSAYPHHVLRENKMLVGAGADRMQTGMQLSFGKPVGIAARVAAGDKIFTVACLKEAIPAVRAALDGVRAKLPGKKAITVAERKD